jgi:hypothetical protein
MKYLGELSVAIADRWSAAGCVLHKIISFYASLSLRS